MPNCDMQIIRKDIRLTHSDYQSAIRRANDLLFKENKNQVEIGIKSKEEANADWAANANLQDLLILMRRAGVSIDEITKWVKQTEKVRQALGIKAAKNQRKIF